MIPALPRGVLTSATTMMDRSSLPRPCSSSRDQSINKAQSTARSRRAQPASFAAAIPAQLRRRCSLFPPLLCHDAGDANLLLLSAPRRRPSVLGRKKKKETEAKNKKREIVKNEEDDADMARDN